MENYTRIDIRLDDESIQDIYSIMQSEKKKKSDVIRELVALGISAKKQQKSGEFTLSVKEEVMLGLLLKIKGMLYEGMRNLLSDDDNKVSITQIKETINNKLAESIEKVEQGQVRYKNLKI